MLVEETYRGDVIGPLATAREAVRRHAAADVDGRRRLQRREDDEHHEQRCEQRQRGEADADSRLDGKQLQADLARWHGRKALGRGGLRAGLIIDPPANVARNDASITPTTRALGKLACATFLSSVFYRGAPKPPVAAA